MTPAEPDQGVPGTARARLQAAALGVVAALLVPLPVHAAPAPCEQALRYAAQSGAGLMRIGNLDLGPAGRDEKSIKDVGVGDAKSALVAQSAINAAALGRVLDGGPADRKGLAEVFQQTAPPTHQKPKQRRHDATKIGPFSLGASKLTVHARWEPGMACGNAEGEATRAEAELRRTGVLDDGDAALLHVPGKISSLSTTAMERRGPAARAVAAASLAGDKIELLGGAVTVKVVQPPSLLATMSAADGGEVRYQPAVLEVSGAGFKTARLDTAGDNVEFHLDENGSPAPDPDRAAAGQLDAARTGTDGDGNDRAGADADSQAGAKAARTGLAGKTGAGGEGKTAAGKTGTGSQGKTAPGTNGQSKSDASKAGADSKGRTGADKADAGKAGVDGQGKSDAGEAGKAGAGSEDAGKPAAGNGSGTSGNSAGSSSGSSGAGEPEDGLFAGLPEIGTLGSSTPLPLPSLPGVPPLGAEPGTEGAPAAGPGTTVRVSLGDVRQAVSGHAIAAKATAMKIAITKRPDRTAYGDSAPNRSGTVLDFDMGLLEVAAVAPEPTGGVSSAVGGDGGGLPITGPRLDVLALTGVALLIAGAAALIFGLRGRSRP
ncbi:hypothetical protein DMB66_25700 [Actinoplanes sp. ATCC 53533]|nr:hypothetical protein DMB66_25700 [Actinoplanes sp. ATCC 53533]